MDLENKKIKADIVKTTLEAIKSKNPNFIKVYKENLVEFQNFRYAVLNTIIDTTGSTVAIRNLFDDFNDMAEMKGFDSGIDMLEDFESWDKKSSEIFKLMQNI